VREPTAAEIEHAADVLRWGGLVAFPTETVYGLGADASSPDALRRLYAVKGRPADHPVIVHLAAGDQLDDWATAISPDARRLADTCWPGPLTVIVPRAPRVPDEVTGGLPTVGLRVPDQPVALALLRAFGSGVAAPSANRFGRVSPTTADDVRADLDGDVDVVLDGGPCRVGVESTIVDCSADPPVIVRQGGVPRERVEQILGHDVEVQDEGSVRAPGTLPSHYAPRARVQVETPASAVSCAIAAVASGTRVGVIAPALPSGLPHETVVLGIARDVDDYAHSLYAWLRAADAQGLDVVVAVPPAEDGIGAAVADRLRRAAGGRR
jgi:L-threonylcarbamoyladenylate synthase